MKLNKEEIRDSSGRFTKAMVGPLHYQWVGDSVGYGALHSWVSRVLGKPKVCSECGSTDSRKYEWANISKQYKRDSSDWKRMCTACHHKFDSNYSKMMETRSKLGHFNAKGNGKKYVCGVCKELVSDGYASKELCRKHYLKEYYKNSKDKLVQYDLRS